MPIDLTNLSPENKTAILGALGLNEAATRTASENLSNKTLISPAFQGTCSGQIDLAGQTTQSEYSVLTSSTLRRELMSRSASIQRYNTMRAYVTAGGKAATGAGIGGVGTANNAWTDVAPWSRQTINTTGARVVSGAYTDPGTADLDHTSWAVKQFGPCYVDYIDGNGVNWDKPFSFHMRLSYCFINAGVKAMYYAGICDRWTGGTPTGRGVGICFDETGYRMWSHSGVSFASNMTQGSSTITTTGAHGFSVGSRIRFVSVPTAINASITADTTYFVTSTTGTNQFTISSLSATGANITFGATTTTAAQVSSLPLYSSYIGTTNNPFPAITDGSNAHQNILINVDGLGLASLYYSRIAGESVSTAPVAQIAVPATASSTPVVGISFTTTTDANNPWTDRKPAGVTPVGGIFSGISMICASFAPFGV